MLSFNVSQPHPPENMDSSVPPTPANTAIPVTIAIPMPDKLMHKSHLQNYTQTSCLQLPIYLTTNEGLVHLPSFRATVIVDGATYTSTNTFKHRKEAEQDAARVAFAAITEKLKTEEVPIVVEDIVLSKTILNEFVTKMSLERPIYHTIQSEGFPPSFLSSVVIKGVTYTGASSSNKKDAEHLAARAAVTSFLGDSNYGTVVSEIIKCKGKQCNAPNKSKHSVNIQIGIVPLEAQFGTGQNPVNSTGISVEVAKVVAANTSPPIGISKAYSGQSTHHPVLLPQPFHQFNLPGKLPQPEAIAPPIVFVPPAQQQTLAAPLSSGKKRKRKNKKKKQSHVDVKLDAANAPFNQVQPCSEVRP